MQEFLHVNSLTLHPLPLTEKHNLLNSPAIYFALGQAGEIVFYIAGYKVEPMKVIDVWLDSSDIISASITLLLNKSRRRGSEAIRDRELGRKDKRGCRGGFGMISSAVDYP